MYVHTQAPSFSTQANPSSSPSFSCLCQTAMKNPGSVPPSSSPFPSLSSDEKGKDCRFFEDDYDDNYTVGFEPSGSY